MSRILKIVGVVFCATILLGSCKPGVPRDFIQPDDMEKLLYDYHLADAMAEQATGDRGANIIAYREAVLKKYGVSQAQFDSSMVYYMRHTDELHTIYQHISDRMQTDARNMGSNVIMGTAGVAGDSTDVWKLDRSMVLIPNEPFNVFNFAMKADSTFHKGDVISLLFHSNFIFQDGMRDGVVMLAVTFQNDSVATSMAHVSTSQALSVSVTDTKQLGIKEIRGFFLLNRNNMANSSSTTLQMASFYGIHLLRVHQKPQPNAPKPLDESIPSDSMRRSISTTDKLQRI